MCPHDDDPVHRLQRDVERMFHHLVYHGHTTAHFGEPLWSPPTDLVVSEQSARVIVELAGVPREQVRVQLRGNLLEISGRRHPPAQEAEGTHYHRAEIFFGEFRRSIELPWVADETRVDARFRDGLLEIHLAPTPVREHTEIPVERQGSS